MNLYTNAINNRFKEERTITEPNDKPDIDYWSESKDDQDFVEEFQRVFTADEIPETDELFDPDSFDQYINMEVALDRPGVEHPQLATVTKRIKDNDGNPIGKSNKFAVLDTRQYEIEFKDGYTEALSANLIAQSIFS